MLEALASSVVDFIASFGYLAVFILMTLESALIPIPSEITMPFAGFLVGLGKLNFWVVVLIGGTGNLVGSLVAYALGYWGEEAVVRKVIKNYGKYLLITEHEFDKAEKWFRVHGNKIAFFSRLMPVVRTFISLPAGIARMNIVKFSFYTFVGSLFWSAFLVWLGVVLGQNWHLLGNYFRKFDIVIVAVGVGLAGFYVYRKVKKIRKNN